MIRPATLQDIPAICAIWNPVIRESLAIFSAVEKTPEAVAAMMAERSAAGFAFFVAESGGEIKGFATYAQFRGGDGYARTMEHTVMLKPDARGLGLGRALMRSVEDHAAAGGAHSIFAGVSATNTEGIAFHAAVGYRNVATLQEVGYKFGQWIDLVLMQKNLAAPR